MRNILLPTDFSSNSMNAIDYAMRFFEKWECNFFILNVQKTSEYISDDLVSATNTDTIYDSIATDNKKLINQLVKKLTKKYKSQTYTFRGLFDYDDFVSAVQQAVQFHNIELIVMGSNGATGAKEQLFGSNTLQVIRNVNCPILTIPDHYKFTTVKNTLFSLNNDKDFSIESTKIFNEIVTKLQSDINVLEFNFDATNRFPRDIDESFREFFPNHRCNFYHLTTTPGLTAITTVTQLLKIDLHAIFVEKESFFERLFYGSENSELLYRTLVPLLCLHP